MIVQYEIIRDVDVSREVCLWNTWDHEHLFYVHRQFKDAKIIYEDKNVALIRTSVQIPYTPIYLNCLHTMTSMKNGDVMVVDALPFGVLSKLEMRYIELEEFSTRLHNLYTLHLPIFFLPFKKLIPKLIQYWNDVNWEEDIALKNRRQQALNSNFRDFYGISEVNASKGISLPLPRTKDSILNE